MGYPAKFIPRKRKKFLEDLRIYGNVHHACRAIHVQPSCVYEWRKKDEEFAKEWDDALEEAMDGLEQEAYRRGVEGVDKPIFWQGLQVATVKEYSDTVLLALLAARRPGKWGRKQVDIPNGLNANLTIKWQGDDGNNGPL